MTDQEGRSRRENVRIHGVKEGAEENAPSAEEAIKDLVVRGFQVTVIKPAENWMEKIKRLTWRTS